MHTHEFVRRRQKSIFGVEHPVKDMEPLGIVIDDSRPKGQGCPLTDFTIVSHMRLQHEDRRILGTAIGFPDPQVDADGLRRLIKGNKIIADIHVAVVVDPLRANRRRPRVHPTRFIHGRH